MGVNAQQHRICTGLFYNVRVRNVVHKNVSCLSMLSGVCSSRCLSNACLLLIYVYILQYMLLITLETQSLNRKVCHLFTNQSEYIFNRYGPQLTIYLLTILKNNRLRSSATEFREHFCPKTIEVQNIAKRFLKF